MQLRVRRCGRRTFHTFGELGYAFTAGDACTEPFANAGLLHQHIGGFSENGGAAALVVDDADSGICFTTLGVRGATMLSLSETLLALRGSVGWRHAVGGVTPESTHAVTGGTPFTVSGTPVARDMAGVQTGLDLSLSDTATLSLGYEGQFAGNVHAHGGKVRLTLEF